jgi:transposase
VPGSTALGLPTENKALHATERDTARVPQARADDHALTQPLEPQRVKVGDESGVNLAMTRRFGRAPRGARVSGAVPQTYGAHVTRSAALSLPGIEAVMTSAGATEAEVCPADAEQVLGPTLCPGDLVGSDTLSAHQLAPIRAVIAGRGARLLYVPPYSPDLAPIEHAWSKITTVVRAATARTRAAWARAIPPALTTLTAADAHGWFT